MEGANDGCVEGADDSKGLIRREGNKVVPPLCPMLGSADGMKPGLSHGPSLGLSLGVPFGYNDGLADGNELGT